MKIKVLITVLSLFSLNLAHTAPISESTIQIKNRNALVGLWAMQIPENQKCHEYYNFKSNQSVLIQSAKEWSFGHYTYQPSFDQDAVPALMMLHILYDNNQTDCSGIQEDQSGEISRFAVTWKNSNQISFCAEDQSKQCFANLKRILP